MKTVLVLIFLGLLASAMGGKAVGNFINDQLAQITAAVDGAGLHR